MLSPLRFSEAYLSHFAPGEPGLTWRHVALSGHPAGPGYAADGRLGLSRPADGAASSLAAGGGRGAWRSAAVHQVLSGRCKNHVKPCLTMFNNVKPC